MKIGQSAGKSYAYLLGVFLGDGCVTTQLSTNSGHGVKRYPVFRLNTIDPEFAEATKAALEVFTDRSIAIHSYNVSKSSKPNYDLRCGDPEICAHLLSVTDSKQSIPGFVFDVWSRDEQIAFIEGLMDSEGFVAERKAEITNRRFYMGFKSCDVWVPDFLRLLEVVGIRFGKVSQEVPRKVGYKVPTRFHIKMQSWIDAGATFRIHRKQRRVQEWASATAYEQRSRHPRRLSSTTNMPGSSAVAAKDEDRV
jgi:hypothetical protein